MREWIRGKEPIKSANEYIKQNDIIHIYKAFDVFTRDEWKRLVKCNKKIKNRFEQTRIERFIENHIPDYLTYKQVIAIFKDEEFYLDIIDNIRKYRIGNGTKYRLADIKRYLEYSLTAKKEWNI